MWTWPHDRFGFDEEAEVKARLTIFTSRDTLAQAARREAVLRAALAGVNRALHETRKERDNLLYEVKRLKGQA